MENPFIVWSSNIAKNPGACQYYRIDVPMRSLFQQKYAQCYTEKGENPKEALDVMFHSDIVQFYSAAGEGTLHKVKTLRNLPDSVERPEGTRYSPSLVYDVDDNFDFVHPFNSTFAHLGVRSYPDGALLKPGDCLTWTNAAGETKDAWVDMESHNGPIVFDIARNLHEMKIRHEVVRACHGATVSSKALASYFTDVIGQKNVYVYPNTIIPEDYEQYDVVRKNPDEVRILWQGSMSHIVDWHPLRDAVKAVSQKYPQVKWVIYGEYFDWIHDVIPEHMIEHHGWTDYPAYKIKRGLLNADINLCPLANNPFNRCKSAIKWYEGSIWNRPEATLAANVEPYHEIVDGVTGLLYNTPEEFAQKLGLLIEDAALRARLGQAARRWVLENRTPEKTTPGLFEFYQDVRAQKKQKSRINLGANSAEEIKRLSMQEHALRTAR